ncbi:hypothetical protein PtA15_6A428 [Puccinia triticina]|uniref:Uncharacterized protein n=1 Tax=Puccinia triticina TaxID=208348 RepID=A0ABY7CKP5_9BASI|nr:uncharacterized protein PtA15_6A428 [Puccinia triticina]WAQ85799.1 hypothetical protein PtA15_6A428 [Puccinia triticina]
MWLPAYLLLFASISQLISNIDASLDSTGSKIWLCESRLLKDQEKEPELGLTFPGSTPGFWSTFDSYGSPTAAFPNSGIQWAQELHCPNEGLSKNFRMWDTLQWQLIGEPEPRLKPLVDAKNKNDYTYIIENLDKVIGEIFSSQPAKDLSAQTRVASIAAPTCYSIMNELYFQSR